MVDNSILFLTVLSQQQLDHSQTVCWSGLEIDMYAMMGGMSDSRMD